MSIYHRYSLPYEPFVYLIGWSHLDKFYIGCRYGKTVKAHPSQLWTTYFTSSKYVKEFREINGEPDIIRIEKIFDDPKKCIIFESKLNFRMNVIKNHKFLNMSYGGEKFMFIRHSEESKEKMKLGAKNRLPKSIETRKKISDNLRNRPPMTIETRLKISNKNKGSIRTDEARKKMSISQKNRQPLSLESRQRMSLAALAKPPVTDKTKEKLSIAQKNRGPISDETKLKMSLAALARPPDSAETHEKKSSGQRNRAPDTAETHEKKCIAQRKRGPRPPPTKESNIKRSESMKKTLAAKKALKESSQINQSLTD